MKNTLLKKFVLAHTPPYSHIAVNIFDLLISSAAEHADLLNVSLESLLSQNLTWMLSYLNAEFFSIPNMGEEISVETWPSGTKKLYSCRDFIVKDKNGKLIAKASTGWLVVNTIKRRPVRLPAEVLNIQPSTLSEVVSAPDKENFKTQDFQLIGEILVDEKDIDINNHVTTVSYIDWILRNAIPNAKNARLKSFYIEFKAESFLGEEILSYAGYEQNKSIISGVHKLLNKENQKEHSSALSAWEI